MKLPNIKFNKESLNFIEQQNKRIENIKKTCNIVDFDFVKLLQLQADLSDYVINNIKTFNDNQMTDIKKIIDKCRK